MTTAPASRATSTCTRKATRCARQLPLYCLLDAVRAFDKDKALKAALGESFSASYVKLKTQEWDEYSKHPTEWERTTTLDC